MRLIAVVLREDPLVHAFAVGREILLQLAHDPLPQRPAEAAVYAAGCRAAAAARIG